MARTANEDFFGYWEPDDDRAFDLKGRLVVVCDGMGGHIGGEIASRMAVKECISFYESSPSDDIVDNLRKSVERANAAVHGEARKQPELMGMGTTCTAMVHRRGVVYFGQVGDSRAYLLRGGAMKQMTKDHSLVQQLVDEGLLDESEMETHPDKNVILRSLGVKPEVEVDVSHVPIINDDLLLLCSDGLSGLVSDAEMLAIVNKGLADGGKLRQICESLIDAANAAGGHDNITVQILRVKTTESATTDTTPPETVTQSFTPDEVQESIAKARAEAQARGETPKPKPKPAAASTASTDPMMPVPTVEAPASSGAAAAGGAGGLAIVLVLGLVLGLGIGFLLFGGTKVSPDADAAHALLNGAKSQAEQAGAAESEGFKAAAKKADAGMDVATNLDAAQEFLDAATAAQRVAATEARDRAETMRARFAGKDSPLVGLAMGRQLKGTQALKVQQYAKARALFSAAEALFEAVEAGE